MTSLRHLGVFSYWLPLHNSGILRLSEAYLFLHLYFERLPLSGRLIHFEGLRPFDLFDPPSLKIYLFVCQCFPVGLALIILDPLWRQNPVPYRGLTEVCLCSLSLERSLGVL